jgi:uncharacterized protein (TIGR02453 family)
MATSTKSAPARKVPARKQKAATSQAGSGRFTGFSKQALQFLRDLKKNQDRDWFRERKDLYEQFVRQPMEDLVLEASAACRKRGFPLYAKEKSPVMRVYRDIRFSPNKDPFNTRVGAGLRRTPGKEGFGEVYIHVSPESSFLAAGFWMPERPFVNAWRQAMDRDPKKFRALLDHLKKHKFQFMGERSLVRLPRGFEAHQGGDLEGHFKLTSYVIHRPLSASEYGSPKMLDSVVEFALISRPLLEFGWALNHQPPRDPLGVEW